MSGCIGSSRVRVVTDSDWLWHSYCRSTGRSASSAVQSQLSVGCGCRRCSDGIALPHIAFTSNGQKGCAVNGRSLLIGGDLYMCALSPHYTTAFPLDDILCTLSL
ncbi:unnamed protein product [Oppiella nova]|uniref:Uncharacterized protein n=1 Tax=Oppiella nova TaxID=334625 RepID=A0A7R9M9Y4_9ACAR|nr:unnamed protein product [Oppiella nova]CAG2173459.1 unnamed protein product [Oppiella nova]